jgi:hypothetical protein
MKVKKGGVVEESQMQPVEHLTPPVPNRLTDFGKFFWVNRPATAVPPRPLLPGR